MRTIQESPLPGGDLGAGNTRRKKNQHFHFKQFAVRHDRSGMKVGTDGVLLGAWTDVSNATCILDIGTGTGVIALMLAQRTLPFVQLDAIEIDQQAVEDAAENFAASPWKERLTLHHSPVQHFTPPKTFDLIVSNPPYFIGSYKPPGSQRIVARHHDALSFAELITTALRLLTAHGRLSIILPYTEGLAFLHAAMDAGLHCTRKWSFRSRPEKPVERWLLEFSRINATTETGEIVLYKSNKGEEWSDGYAALTRDFYLKL